MHITVQYATGQPCRACHTRCAGGCDLSPSQGHLVALALGLLLHVPIIHALLGAQGALSPRSLVVHCRDIIPMSRHGKFHVPGFSVATESLEKFIAIENLCHNRKL